MAVLLMDTQGTFDSVTSMNENAFMFALSTLASSVQIYNLSERIQMDDLQNLQYFLEFGRLVHDASSSKVFSKLLFLVRDWRYPEELKFGFEGGTQLLNEVFKVPF
ncbi:UNVERIFIED_CONTAM: hypothetical protein B566_EDAN019285 [Ephemera danica]|nr:hypothetical protein B566_EDAN019285 [Ephemera danica]